MRATEHIYCENQSFFVDGGITEGASTRPPFPGTTAMSSGQNTKSHSWRAPERTQSRPLGEQLSREEGAEGSARLAPCLSLRAPDGTIEAGQLRRQRKPQSSGAFSRPPYCQPLTSEGLSSMVVRETQHFRFFFFLSDCSSPVSNSFPFLCLALKS